MVCFWKNTKGLFLFSSVIFLVSCDVARNEQEIAQKIIPDRLLWSDVNDPMLSHDSTMLRLGDRIYRERCIACHGKTGLGDGVAAAYMHPRPRDFSTGEFKLLSTIDYPSDEDLYRTVTVGIPAFGMPSFEYLSPQERWAVVNYIKELGISEYAFRLEVDMVKEELGLDLAELDAESTVQHWETLIRIRKESANYAAEQHQPGTPLEIPDPLPRTKQALERGEVLYLGLGCASCHGVRGEGNGNSVESMTDNQGRVIRPRDFREGSWYFKGGNRQEDIMRVILGGMPGTPMPSLDLGEKENRKLWDLAYYVEFLATSDEGV